MKTLDEMTDKEFEDLCDRCGLCCHMPMVVPSRVLSEKGVKAPGLVVSTETGMCCDHLDLETRQCKVFEDDEARRAVNCLHLTRDLVKLIQTDNNNLIDTNSATYVMPDTCGYVRALKGEELDPHHPLVTGDPTSMAEHVKSGMKRQPKPRSSVMPEQMFGMTGVSKSELRNKMLKHVQENRDET